MIWPVKRMLYCKSLIWCSVHLSKHSMFYVCCDSTAVSVGQQVACIHPCEMACGLPALVYVVGKLLHANCKLAMLHLLSRWERIVS